MIKPVTIDGQAYVCPNWQEMGEMSLRLAKKISLVDTKFDRLIALAKGGWGWARQMQDLLSIPTQSSIQISFYEGIGETKKTPVVIQSLPISILNESVLIYDDVVDSGETLELAKNYLRTHGASSVVTASHFIKKWTKTKPDFFVETADAWIIFPHDVIENIDLVVKKWGNLTKSETEERLLSMGIDRAILKYYLA